MSAETILVVPPPSQDGFSPVSGPGLHLAFALAKPLLADGRRVRIIGHCATIRSAWPDWVAETDRLTLDELGQYRCGDPVLATRPLARAVDGWLDGVFGGTAPGLSSGRFIYATAVSKMFQDVFEAETYVHGLATAHPDAEFMSIDPDWIGLQMLRQIVDERARAVRPRPSGRQVRWSGRLYVRAAYNFSRAVAGQLLHFAQSRASRLELRRRARRAYREPSVWLAMVPDWVRINQHVLNEWRKIPPGCESVGVILVSTLKSGERTDAALNERSGQMLWPGLAELRFENRIPVIQMVGPDSLGSLIRLLITSLLRSMSVVRRLSRSGEIDLGTIRIDVSGRVAALAELATTSVVQAVATSQAFARAKRRFGFAGAKVIFSSVGLVDTETPNLLLQQEEAITVDFKHGAGGDGWYGRAESRCVLTAVWSAADKQQCLNLGRCPVVVPQAPEIASAKPITRPRNILLMTGYAHVDWEIAHFPFGPLQTELLSVVRLLELAFPGRFEFRWRPHPNDDIGFIRRGQEQVPDVQLSRGTPLAADLEWAHIAISSISSTVTQAVQVGLPVFVQAMPANRFLPDMLAVPASRQFFYAEQLVQPFSELVSRLDQSDPSALADDMLWRSGLFDGSSGGKSLIEAISAVDRLACLGQELR